METFKEGYYWVKWTKGYFVTFLSEEDDLLPDEEIIEYLGKDYDEFIGLFKIKAS